ncbi:MAG: hypothetical protein P8X57_15165, partial [Cyclobacteriaceae bacterium]
AWLNCAFAVRTGTITVKRNMIFFMFNYFSVNELLEPIHSHNPMKTRIAEGLTLSYSFYIYSLQVTA